MQFKKLAQNLDDPWTLTLIQRHIDPAQSAASRVAHIPELLETILLHVEPKALRTNLQRVSKFVRNNIMGSVNLQRRLHYAPTWKQPRIDLAPMPRWICRYSRLERDVTGELEPGARVQSNVEHYLYLRFATRALPWACDPALVDNRSFRHMQLCQPPIVAVEFSCWSDREKPSSYVNVKRVVENEGGITCGQIVDLALEFKANLGHVILTYQYK